MEGSSLRQRSGRAERSTAKKGDSQHENEKDHLDFRPHEEPGKKAKGLPRDGGQTLADGEEGTHGNEEELLWRWMSLASVRSGWQKWKLILSCVRPQRDASRGLILCMLGCVVVLVIDRGINIILPLANKRVINSLMATEQSKGEVPPNWSLMVYYILLNTLHGGGFLGSLRQALWLRVAQNIRKQLHIKLFDKVMGQSLRWHIQKRTGEVTRIMDRGVNSVNSILSQVLFNLIPAVVDVSVAVVFFLSAFDFWTGLIVFGSMVGYLLSAIFLGKQRRTLRQTQNEAANQMHNTLLDALMNFETVKYHAAEKYEIERYSKNIDKVQEAELKTNMSVAVVQFSQRGMKNLGLLGGSLLCALRVSEGTFTVGDYILFVTYLGQVYGPLNTFGGYLRTLQQNIIDMDSLFDIIQQVPEIHDTPGAKDIEIVQGKVEFQNVNFHYNPEKEILKGVSFSIEPGKTVALVGHSGFSIWL